MPGKEMNTILIDNKTVLKKKKQQARDVAIEINKTKQSIDDNIAEMKAKCSYFNEDFSKLEEQVLDEDVFITLMETKKLKKRYRELMDVHQRLMQDISHCNHLVTECRKRLISDFREWFDAVGGNMDELDSIKLDESESVTLREVQTPVAAPASAAGSHEPGSDAFYAARASMFRKSFASPEKVSRTSVSGSANRRRNIMFQ